VGERIVGIGRHARLMEADELVGRPLLGGDDGGRDKREGGAGEDQSRRAAHAGMLRHLYLRVTVAAGSPRCPARREADAACR